MTQRLLNSPGEVDKRRSGLTDDDRIFEEKKQVPPSLVASQARFIGLNLVNILLERGYAAQDGFILFGV